MPPDAYRDLVVSERQRHGHGRLALRTQVRPSISTEADLRQLPQIEFELAGHAVFAVYHEMRAIAQLFRRHLQRQFAPEPVSSTTTAGGSRRSHSWRSSVGQRLFQIRRGIRRHSQGAQNRLLGRRRRNVAVAEDIPESGVDSKPGCGAVE